MKALLALTPREAVLEGTALAYRALRDTLGADANGMLYVYPDGTENGLGRQFWNATEACCGEMNMPVAAPVT